MEKLRTAYRLNLILVFFVLLSTLWMMSGITGGPLSAGKLAMFRFFTVDSNILMGIIALLAALEQRKVLKGRKERVSPATYVLLLTGTVGVTLTMLVTIFFLEPTMAPQFGLFGLFAGSNFFLHLFNPVLSIVNFLRYEKTAEMGRIHTLTGIVPMLLYGVYYTVTAVVHSANGVVQAGYDWYGFLAAGVNSAFFVLPGVILFTWLISWGLWKLNRKNA